MPEEPSSPSRAPRMDAGEEKKFPKDLKSPSWLFTVALKALPGFKLKAVPGDESEPPHLERARAASGDGLQLSPTSHASPGLRFIACLLCRGLISVPVEEGWWLCPSIVPALQRWVGCPGLCFKRLGAGELHARRARRGL